jgi:amidase
MAQKPLKPGAAPLDVLNADAVYLQSQLGSGKLSSVEIVDAYLQQIGRHNHNGMGLRSLISVAPRELALSKARELDEERQVKGSRGPVHGIPFIIKVCSRFFASSVGK